jgi:uroporphyrinogen decarboxylase
VPVDVGGSACTSILVEGYDRLKAHLGIVGETKMLSQAMRIALLDEAAMQRLGSDCRPLLPKPPINWSPPESEPGSLIDEWGIKWRRVDYAMGHYWEVAHSPLADACVEDLQRYSWPDPLDPGRMANLAEEAETLYEGTEYAIVGECGFKGFWEPGYMLRGYERLLIDLVTQPEFVAGLMNKLLEINMLGTGQFLDAVGPYIQVFRAGDDLATQRGLMMSPKTFRRLLKPVYRTFFDFVKSKTRARILFHSCGNVTELIDDLIEMGVDAINPVQVSAMGDMAELKTRFGQRISFWGGIDTQGVLPFGTQQDVREEVRRRIRDLAPGGGYVLAAVHNIQPDVPPQNIVTMTEAARKLGIYPIKV